MVDRFGVRHELLSSYFVRISVHYFLFCCSLMVFLSISNLLVSIVVFPVGFVGFVWVTFLLNFLFDSIVDIYGFL